MKLLMIDDNKELLNVMAELLPMMNSKFSLKTCINADEGIRIIKNSSYDFVIVDYLMPGDTHAITDLLEDRKIPYIIYTGAFLPNTPNYFCKNRTFTELVELISKNN